MNFNVLAPVYDRLARSVFGRRWIDIQQYPAMALNDAKSVLILGGGTGHILEVLHVPEVVYVEQSEQMIRQAKRRVTSSSISWECTDFLTWRSEKKFDAIYCPFFLDCFAKPQLTKALTQIDNLLSSDGYVYILDFRHGNPWQQIVNWLMVLFFRLFSGLQATRLEPINQRAEKAGFECQSKRYFLKGWVFFRVYQKGVKGHL